MVIVSAILVVTLVVILGFVSKGNVGGDPKVPESDPGGIPLGNPEGDPEGNVGGGS